MSDNFKKSHDENFPMDGDWERNSEGLLVRPTLVRLSDVIAKPVMWLWDNIIPFGALTLIVGIAGIGKSFLTVFLTDRVTNGVPWKEGRLGETVISCEEGSVLFFNGEDGLADTYVQRCRANGVNQERVMFMTGAKVLIDGKEGYETSVNLADIKQIEKAIINTGKTTGLTVKLVVIDPVGNYWGKVNENSNAGVRSVLYPLHQLAERMGIAIVMIQHVGKGNSNYAQQKILGSTGLPASCRAVWVVSPDPEDEDKRILAIKKANWGHDHTAVLYQIKAPDGYVEIIDTDIPKTAQDIELELAAAHKAAKRGDIPGKQITIVMEWLVEFLRATGGERAANEVYEEGYTKGFSERTIDRAKRELGIESVKRGFGKDSVSYWVLPVADAPELEPDDDETDTDSWDDMFRSPFPNDPDDWLPEKA